MGKTVSNTLLALQTTNSLKNLNYFLQYQPRCLPDQTRPITMTRASQRATKSSSSMPNRVQLFPSNAFPRVQNMIVGGHIRFGNMALVKVVTCKRDLVDLHGG